MQLFAIHDILGALWIAATAAWEFRGVLAEEALRLVFLPLHEFSLASCIVSLGWIAIFWKNKGLLLSGLSHMLHVADWFTKTLRLERK